MAITKEEVFEVATAIAQEGEKPTSINIRERLGSGSYTTITGYLKEWKISRRDLTSIHHQEIPTEIRDAGSEFVRLVWSAASSWVGRELTTARKLTSEQVEEAETQTQEAMTALDLVERERDELLRTKELLGSQCSQLVAQCSGLEATVTALRAELQNERQHNRTLSDRLGVEGAKVAALEERRKLEYERSHNLEAELQALRIERTELERRTQALSDRLTEVTGKAERAEERARQLGARLDAVRS